MKIKLGSWGHAIISLIVHGVVIGVTNRFLGFESAVCYMFAIVFLGLFDIKYRYAEKKSGKMLKNPGIRAQCAGKAMKVTLCCDEIIVSKEYYGELLGRVESMASESVCRYSEDCDFKREGKA